MKKLIRPLIAILFLGLILKMGFIKLDQLNTSIHNIQLMTSGFILIGLQVLLFAYRWKIIVNIYKRLSYFKILKLNLISQFFNVFIPGGIGGDVVKAIELSKRENIKKNKTLTTIFVDRALGLYCMIAFSTIFLMLAPRENFDLNTYFLTSLFMLIAATVGLVFIEKISLYLKTISVLNRFHIITKIIHGLETIAESIKSVFQFKTLMEIAGISLIAQLLAISFLYIVLISIVPQPPPFVLFFPLACFAFMASAIPITPGGIGFGQAAFYFIFKIFSPEVANAVVVGISLMQLFNILFSLPGIYFFIKIPKYEHTKGVTDDTTY